MVEGPPNSTGEILSLFLSFLRSGIAGRWVVGGALKCAEVRDSARLDDEYKGTANSYGVGKEGGGRRVNSTLSRGTLRATQNRAKKQASRSPNSADQYFLRQILRGRSTPLSSLDVPSPPTLLPFNPPRVLFSFFLPARALTPSLHFCLREVESRWGGGEARGFRLSEMWV